MHKQLPCLRGVRQLRMPALVILLVCWLVGRPTLAQQHNNPYVRVGAGAAWLGDVSLTLPGFDSFPMKFDTGYRVDASFGYRFVEGAQLSYGYRAFQADLAVEVETGLQWNPVKSVGDATLDTGGGQLDLYQYPILVNVVLGAPIFVEELHFSLCGGVGGVVAHWRADPPDGSNVSETSVTFAAQAGVRFAYDLTPHLSAGLFYQALWLDEVHLDVAEGEHTWSHSVGLDVTWNF